MPVGDPVKSVYGWTIRLLMHLLYALLQNPLECIEDGFYERILIAANIQNQQQFCTIN